MENNEQSKEIKGRLDFLRNFLALNNIQFAEVAKVLGCSAPNVSYIFSTADDMRMLDIEKVIKAFGYQVQIFMVRDPKETSVIKVNPDLLVVNEKCELELPPLYYLKIAMKRYGFTRPSLAKALGMETCSVRYWLVSEKGIMLSRLLQVCDVMDVNLIIKIIKPEDSNAPKLEGRRMVVDYAVHSELPVKGSY